MALQNIWITSPLVGIDLQATIIRTTSADRYILGTQDPELNPDLRDHLAYALRAWGFDRVRA